MPHDPRDYVVDLKVTLPIDIDTPTAQKIVDIKGNEDRAVACVTEMTRLAWTHKGLREQIARGVLKSLEGDEQAAWIERMQNMRATFRVKDYTVPSFNDDFRKPGFISSLATRISYEATFIVTVRVLFDTPPSKDDLMPEDFMKRVAEKKAAKA